MLGVEGYGSDNDSDNETTTITVTPKPTSSLVSKLPPPAKKSSFSLPPPSNANPSSSTPTTGISLPPPKKKGPKKITIGLPSLPDEDNKSEVFDERPTKKARIESGTGKGAGSSGLLSMLPAPKNKAPTLPKKEQSERVLGGGKGPGLVFKTASTVQAKKVTVEDEEDEDEEKPSNLPPESSSILEEVKETTKTNSSLPFLPPSLAKGKANVSTEDRHTRPVVATPKVSAAPAIDFFGLGSSSSSASVSIPNTSIKPTISTPTAKPSILPTSTLSSAPKVDEFTPPEPTAQDPYPGYYLLPSGQWAQYDPAYYKTFYDKWKKDYDAHVRALEKGIEKGFEGVEKEGATEVNAAKEMERAKVEIKELEERKALTANGAVGEPAAPKMNIKGAALSGRARTRHQLSSLLTEAYQNRETLEEKIAQGRRNRKEAGNKYGF
ncbi:Proline-rich protein PRCC [Abortiporus biennis]